MTEISLDESTHVDQLDTSYEPFAQEPVYVALNRTFVDTIPLKGVRRLVDVACGTGLVTGLLVDRILALDYAVADGVEVVGVDVSAQSLRLAVASFARRDDRGRADARFLKRPGEDLPVPDGWADVVTVGNAIQLFDDLPRLLRELHRVTTLDGVLAFNTSFYAGTFRPGTEGFYTEWMRQALARLGAEEARRREAGLPPLRQRRRDGKAAFSRPWLSPEQYVDALAQQGFEVEALDERTVPLGRTELEAIGAYAGLAAVLLSGYPVAVAAEALVAGVRPAWKSLGSDVVPRGWLECLARRR